MSAPRAAVDVGTNSVRLLVHAADGTRRNRTMEVTRLGAGVDRMGHLDDAALARTLDTLARYRQRWESYGVTGRVRIAATSAVRDASDRDRFFTGVREVTGVDAEVLSGTEEAHLAYLGATGAVDVPMPALVLDIGGGSTELIVGDGTDAAASVSLQLGCVRLTERLLASDPPSDAEVAAARELVSERLTEADRALAAQGASPRDVASLIAVAGTATTLAALHLGLEAYEEDRIHATRLPADSLTGLTTRLLAMPAAARAALGPMQPGREDVIHGGALVLEGVVRRYGFDPVVVSESDLLDGLVQSLA